MIFTIERDEIRTLLELVGQSSLWVHSCRNGILDLSYNGKGFTMRPQLSSDGETIRIDVRLDGAGDRFLNFFGAAFDLDICSQLQNKTNGVFKRSSRKDGYVRISTLLELTKLPIKFTLSSLSVEDDEICLEGIVPYEEQAETQPLNGLVEDSSLLAKNLASSLLKDNM